MKKQQQSTREENLGARGEPSPVSPSTFAVGPRPSSTYVTAYELADLLGLDPQTIWRLTRRGKLTFYDCGRGNKRFDIEEALYCLRKKGAANKE